MTSKYYYLKDNEEIYITTKENKSAVYIKRTNGVLHITDVPRLNKKDKVEVITIDYNRLNQDLLSLNVSEEVQNKINGIIINNQI